MADGDNQAASITRPNAFSMYPDESNPDPTPMNQPPPYSFYPQNPQPQQPYLPPQYQPAPGMAPYPQPQYQPAPGTAPYPQPQNRPAPGTAPYPQPRNQPVPGTALYPLYPSAPEMAPYPQPQYPSAPGTAPYPQPQYPPAPGLAPYPQLYYVPPPQQQQQQQQEQQQSSNVVFIGGQPAPMTNPQSAYVEFFGLIFFSCFVMWCFGSLICGGIAFILTMVGLRSASRGDEKRTRQLLTWSRVLIIAGAVSSIIILAVVIPVTLSSQSASTQHSSIRSTIQQLTSSPSQLHTESSTQLHCKYGYVYRTVKICCAFSDSSMDCGNYGYYYTDYANDIKICCPYI